MTSKPLAKEEIFSRVAELIRRLLNVTGEDGLRSDKEIESKTHIFDDLGIDSVEVLDLFSSIEREFGVVLNMDKVSSIKLVGEVVDYLFKAIQES